MTTPNEIEKVKPKRLERVDWILIGLVVVMFGIPAHLALTLLGVV